MHLKASKTNFYSKFAKFLRTDPICGRIDTKNSQKRSKNGQ